MEKEFKQLASGLFPFLAWEIFPALRTRNPPAPGGILFGGAVPVYSPRPSYNRHPSWPVPVADAIRGQSCGSDLHPGRTPGLSRSAGSTICYANQIHRNDIHLVPTGHSSSREALALVGVHCNWLKSVLIDGLVDLAAPCAARSGRCDGTSLIFGVLVDHHRPVSVHHC